MKSPQGIFISPCFGLLFHFVDAGFDGFEVFYHQFGINNFLVAYRIHRTIDVRHVFIVEAAEHMQDCVRFADIGQKFISQPFAFTCSFHQSGNIHYFYCGGNDFFGIYQFCQFIQPLVGHSDYAHIGFNGAKGKIRRLGFGIGKTIEKG